MTFACRQAIVKCTMQKSCAHNLMQADRQAGLQLSHVHSRPGDRLYCTARIADCLLVVANCPAVGAMELLCHALRWVTEQRPSTVTNLAPCP